MPFTSANTSGENNVKFSHGQHGSRLHMIWCRMKQRCLNPKCDDYKYYGGRGITICQRWIDSFAAFAEDLGEPLPGMTLDRIDGTKGYEPGNVRWATRKQQSQNSTRPKVITVGNRSLNRSEWARELGVSDSAIVQRISRGMTPEQAVTVPFRKSACA